MSLWGRGREISVEADGFKTPRFFVWRGRTHVVDQIDNRWRVNRGWWVTQEWREYFLLTTNTGLLVILYYDFLARQWFLQRVYD